MDTKNASRIANETIWRVLGNGAHWLRTARVVEELGDGVEDFANAIWSTMESLGKPIDGLFPEYAWANFILHSASEILPDIQEYVENVSEIKPGFQLTVSPDEFREYISKYPWEKHPSAKYVRWIMEDVGL